jgi:hypothetical protein
MFYLGAHFLQVSNDWQYVHDKETCYGTYQSQYASDLGVENGDEGGH